MLVTRFDSIWVFFGQELDPSSGSNWRIFLLSAHVATGRYLWYLQRTD